MVALVEDGDANPSLDTVVQLLDGLGLEIDLVVRGQVVIGAMRQRDAAHALCLGHVQRRFETGGWLTAREVRIEDGRYIGWIDLLAYHEPTGTLLIIEVKTQVDDLGGIERSIDWYVRGSRNAALNLGWRPRRVGAWLLVLATGESEARIRDNRVAIDRAFPTRALEMGAIVVDPGGAASIGRGMALIDPRSRRRGWLMRTRVDGRRSDAPYRDYLDFMTRLRGR